MNALDKAIYDYHNTEKTISKILEEYNLTKSTFYAHLDYKEDWRSKKRHRKYKFNLNKIIEDSIDKYYWLGFIAADGAIVDNSLTIELKDVDISHLEKFKNFMETDAPIKIRINNRKVQCSKISINSAELIKYLQTYNIVQNKSLTFTIPEDKIPKEFLIHFIRGLIDGDGCIRINNHQQINLSFCSGNKSCVEQFKNILNMDNKIGQDKNTFRIQVTGNKKAKKILDLIYLNSSDDNRLTRKYNIYKTLG